MSEKLPPLYALKVFELAARVQSFTKAAEQLNITQGAVSKQIKLLEEFLGIDLFTRTGKYLALTPRGETYAILIRDALNAINAATQQCLEGVVEEDIININIIPSSSRWIIPAIQAFQEEYQHIKIGVRVGDRQVDFDRNHADIAVRVAEKNLWSDYHTQIFMKETVIAVCAPSIKTPDLKGPDDMLRFPLIGHYVRPNMWYEFMEAAGCSSIPLNFTFSVEHFFMIIDAAENGIGIALLPEFLIRRELAAGTLVQAIPFRFSSPYHYYLILPKHKASLKKVRLFSAWMKEYAKKLEENSF